MFFSKNLSHVGDCVFHLGLDHQTETFGFSERHRFTASAVRVLYKTNLFLIQNLLVNFVLLKEAISRKAWKTFKHPVLLHSFTKRGAEQREFAGTLGFQSWIEAADGTSPRLEAATQCLRMESWARLLKIGSSMKLKLQTDMGRSPSWVSLPSFSSVPPWEVWDGWFTLDFLSSRKILCYFGDYFTWVHFTLPLLSTQRLA